MTQPDTTTPPIRPLTYRLRPEVKEQWLAALRSGDYRQGTGSLHYQDTGEEPRFCCLGVLCDLAVKAGVVEAERRSDRVDEDHEVSVQYGMGGDTSTTMPPRAVTEWAYEEFPPVHSVWVVAVEDDEDPEDPEDPEVRTTPLAALNDEEDLTFGEIADHIEHSL